MDIINDVVKVLNDSHNECLAIADQIEDYESRIKSGNYSDQYTKETLQPKIDAWRRSIDEIKDQSRRSVHDLTAKFVEEVRRADELNPADMTDDCKLLNVGVKLTANDLRAIVNRNPNNRTMLQLVLRYADEHGIDTGMTYDLSDRYIKQWMGDRRNGSKVLERYFSTKAK